MMVRPEAAKAIYALRNAALVGSAEKTDTLISRYILMVMASSPLTGSTTSALRMSWSERTIVGSWSMKISSSIIGAGKICQKYSMICWHSRGTTWSTYISPACPDIISTSRSIDHGRHIILLTICVGSGYLGISANILGSRFAFLIFFLFLK